MRLVNAVHNWANDTIIIGSQHRQVSISKTGKTKPVVRHPIPSDTTISEDLERKLDLERRLRDKVRETNEINWAHALATVDCQDALWCQLQAV